MKNVDDLRKAHPEEMSSGGVEDLTVTFPFRSVVELKNGMSIIGYGPVREVPPYAVKRLNDNIKNICSQKGSFTLHYQKDGRD